MNFLWPWSKVMAAALMNKKLLVWMPKWESLIQSLWDSIVIPPGHAYHPITFWRNSVGNLLLANYNTRSILWPWHLTSPMTLTLILKYHLNFEMYNFGIALFHELFVWLMMWNGMDANKLDTGHCYRLIWHRRNSKIQIEIQNIFYWT